jgi:hypothetical protein
MPSALDVGITTMTESGTKPKPALAQSVRLCACSALARWAPPRRQASHPTATATCMPRVDTSTTMTNVLKPRAGARNGTSARSFFKTRGGPILRCTSRATSLRCAIHLYRERDGSPQSLHWMMRPVLDLYIVGAASRRSPVGGRQRCEQHRTTTMRSKGTTGMHWGSTDDEAGAA